MPHLTTFLSGGAFGGGCGAKRSLPAGRRSSHTCTTSQTTKTAGAVPLGVGSTKVMVVQASPCRTPPKTKRSPRFNSNCDKLRQGGTCWSPPAGAVPPPSAEPALAIHQQKATAAAGGLKEDLTKKATDTHITTTCLHVVCSCCLHCNCIN